MTQAQQKAFEILKFTLRKQDYMDAIKIDAEDAKSLKRVIENQEGYIKELEKENKELQDRVIELLDLTEIQDNKTNSLQKERDIYFNKMQDLIAENDNMFYQLSHLDKFYKPIPKVKRIKVKRYEEK